MNSVDQYCGPFSIEQVDKLQEMLGLSSRDVAIEVCNSIVGGLFLHSLVKGQKERVGPTTNAKRKLAQIASTAKKLSNLLSDDEICLCHNDELQEALGNLPLLCDLKKAPLWGDAGITQVDMRLLLERISLQAGRLSSNDAHFRSYYYLPPIEDATRNVETYTLWEWLFILWEQHGRTVAATINGPLHRFIQLVHDAAGLSPAEGEALRGAVQAWKADPRRHRPENSIWCYEPKN
ncbi:hypothetical protein [Methylorubrum aminovorans]